MAIMSDDSWMRHANPWSVWTRYAAFPVLIAAIWSRVWIGWWALLPVACDGRLADLQSAGIRAAALDR